MDSEDNANRELIAYYAGPGNKPEEALALAKSEIARRQDVYTLAAYARALRATGQVRKAGEMLARAQAVGTKDPAIAELSRSLE